MADRAAGLLYLPIIKAGLLPIFYLWAGRGGAEADPLASLAPPVHLAGVRRGWTLLLCVVPDPGRGHLEVSWRSSSWDEEGPPLGATSLVPLGTAGRRGAGEPRGGGGGRYRSVITVITVATDSWPSFRCSARRRHAHHVIQDPRPPHHVIWNTRPPHHVIWNTSHQGSIFSAEQKICDEDTITRVGLWWTNQVEILILRLLLTKLLVFNTLITAHAAVS